MGRTQWPERVKKNLIVLEWTGWQRTQLIAKLDLPRKDNI